MVPRRAVNPFNASGGRASTATQGPLRQAVQHVQDKAALAGKYLNEKAGDVRNYLDEKTPSASQYAAQQMEAAGNLPAHLQDRWNTLAANAGGPANLTAYLAPGLIGGTAALTASTMDEDQGEGLGRRALETIGAGLGTGYGAIPLANQLVNVGGRTPMGRIAIGAGGLALAGLGGTIGQLLGGGVANVGNIGSLDQGIIDPESFGSSNMPSAIPYY